MTDDRNWLIGTVVVCAVMLSLYLIGIISRKKTFDLNNVVPMLLGGAATVAASKMIVLAFALPTLQGTKAVASLLDSGSIFVGGLVFFCTTLYASIQVIVGAFAVPDVPAVTSAAAGAKSSDKQVPDANR